MRLGNVDVHDDQVSDSMIVWKNSQMLEVVGKRSFAKSSTHPHNTVAVEERSTVRQHGLTRERATHSEGMELRRERVLLSEADSKTNSFLQFRDFQ